MLFSPLYEREGNSKVKNLTRVFFLLTSLLHIRGIFLNVSLGSGDSW